MNIKGIYYGVGSNIIGNILMLCATVLLTRILAPEQFGEFRVGSSFATMMIPFLAMGGERLVSAVLQQGEENDLYVSEILATVFLVVFLGFIVLLLSYEFLSYYIFEGSLSAVVYVLSISLIPLTIAYNLSNTIWRHRGCSSDAQVHLNLVQRMIRAPAIVVSCFFFPFAFAASFSMILSQSVSLYQARKYLGRYRISLKSFGWSPVCENFRALALVGIPIALMAAVDRIDVLIVNHFFGVAVAGEYDLVFLLSITAMFPAIAMAKTAEPFLAAAKVEGGQKKGKLIKLQMNAFSLSIAALICIVIIVPHVESFLGNASSDFSSAVVLLSAGLAFSSVYGPVLEYLQINGRAKLALSIILIVMAFFFFLKMKMALSGSIVDVAMLSGMFYFSFRTVLALFIYAEDRTLMCPIPAVVFSIISYSLIVFLMWGSR